jgi:quinol monooxygenase YgiN
MSSTTPVLKLARVVGHPGRAAELREALLALEAATRREPGCVAFTLFQALSEAEDFVLLEHFESAAALQSHMQEPHTQAFFAKQLVAGVKAIDVSSLGR